MAHPAWVVRSRRVGARRRSRLGAHSTRQAGQRVRTWSSIGWLTWLSSLFYSLASPSAVAVRAARHARAALDGGRLAVPEPPDNRRRPFYLTFPTRSGQLSLRTAAHAVTLGLVLAVLLTTQQLITGLGVIDTLLTAPHSLDRSAADVQVQRSVQLTDAIADGDIALPAIRAPQAQLVSAFADSHVVAEGETLGQIAAQYGVSVASLFWANDLSGGNVFAAGQELRIPRVAGIPHVVEEGETLEAIAERYHVRPAAIVLFQSNGVREDQPLPVGREIFIPGATLDYPPDLLGRVGGAQGVAGLRAVTAGVVQEADTNLRAGPGRDYPRIGSLDAGRRLKLLARHAQWVKVEDGAGQPGWVRGDLLGFSPDAIAGLPETNDFPPPPPVWVWPARGELSSPFGWRRQPWRMFHDGLDIANAAGTKIYAARGGRVFEAGWCSGFGYCVKIDHGDGITTIYGHMLRRPVVHVGDQVDAGDLIGLMGSTFDRSGGGYSTGVHLHFTVKVNGKAVNPLKFLP